MKNPAKSLRSAYPKIATEWSNLNTTKPENITYGSAYKAWWQCPAGNDHTWKTTVRHRTRGGGCPFCAGQRVSITNCLKTTFPQVAADWSEKNTLSPLDVTARSNKKVWWKCKQGHEWQARVFHRTQGRNCPFCFESKGELKIANYLNSKNIQYKRRVFMPCVHIRKLHFDFVIYHGDDLALIEFQGEQHYRPTAFGSKKPHAAQDKLACTRARDETKRNWCRSQKIPLLEISYLEIENTEAMIEKFLCSCFVSKK